jgi:hypothetical protein
MSTSRKNNNRISRVCPQSHRHKSEEGLREASRDASRQGTTRRCLKPWLFDLCDVTNGPHHGEIVDAPSKKPTRDKLIPLIREALALLERV